MREFAKPFYNSRAWRECRDAYFRRRHGICERCGSPGYIVHHKIYLTPLNIADTNVTLSHRNLELLCVDCHNVEHLAADVIAKGLRFDEEGNIIPPI